MHLGSWCPPAAAALPEVPALLLRLLAGCHPLSYVCVCRCTHCSLPGCEKGSCQPLIVCCAFCQPRQRRIHDLTCGGEAWHRGPEEQTSTEINLSCLHGDPFQLEEGTASQLMDSLPRARASHTPTCYSSDSFSPMTEALWIL